MANCLSGALDEESLVECAKVDPEAFGELFERYYCPIISYVYGRTLNMDIAEEVTSNTFFKALRALPQVRRRGPFKAWLYAIATNELRIHWRHAKRHSRVEEAARWEEVVGRITLSASDIDDPHETVEAIQRFAQLSNALRELPNRYQSALTLRYFEKLSYEEIAIALGKRLGTVKSLIHRGLQQLRVRLETSRAIKP